MFVQFVIDIFMVTAFDTKTVFLLYTYCLFQLWNEIKFKWTYYLGQSSQECKMCRYRYSRWYIFIIFEIMSCHGRCVFIICRYCIQTIKHAKNWRDQNLQGKRNTNTFWKVRDNRTRAELTENTICTQVEYKNARME